MIKLLCHFFGHKWDLKGITGKYEWCSRCRERRQMTRDNGCPIDQGFERP